MLSTLLFIVSCCLRVLSNYRVIKRIHIFTWPKTRVSYAAGTLWPANTLVGSWNGILLASGSGTRPGTAIIRRYTQFQQSKRLYPPSKTPAASSSPVITSTESKSSSRASKKRVVCCVTTSRFSTSRYVESMIYLVNLAVMTDLVVLFCVWWGRGMHVGSYQSKITNKLFLVPHDAVEAHKDVPISWDDYELIMITSTKDLAWQDLFHCGRRIGVNATLYSLKRATWIQLLSAARQATGAPCPGGGSVRSAHSR